MQALRSRDHHRREIDPGQREPALPEESRDVTRPTPGVADGRAAAELVLELLGERGEQRAIEWLVAQLVVDPADIRVGDRVVAVANARLMLRLLAAACYLPDVMRPWTARALAAGVDAGCLALFVALGRASHDISSGIAWYLTVLWPFLVGWFVVAIALQLYRSPLDRWVILACTWIAGSAIGLGLRAAITHRNTPLAFIIVAYIFIGLMTFGWRLFVHGLTWVRGREADSQRVS